METLAVEVNTGSTTKTSELRATTYSGGDVARNFLSSLSSPELIQSTAVPRVRREQRVFTPSRGQHNDLNGNQSGKTRGSQQQLKEIPVLLHPGKTSAAASEQKYRGCRSKPNESMTPPRLHLTKQHGFRGQDGQEKATLSWGNVELRSTPVNSDPLPRGSHTQATKPKGSSPVPPPLASARSGTVAIGARQLSQSGDQMKLARDAERQSKQAETGTCTPLSETKCATKIRPSAKNSIRAFQSAAVQTEDFPASGGQTTPLSRAAMDHYPTPTKADTPPQPITDNGEGTAKAAPSPEAIPSWAVSLIDRVQELETQVTKLQREVELCRSAACTPRGMNRELSRDGKGNRPLDSCPKAGDDVDSPSPLAVPSRILDSAPTAPSESDDITLINGESRSKFKSETKSSLWRPTAPDSGFEKRQLIEDYIHLNDLIVTNETAINDAREYVKMIKEVDEMQAAENQRQIMELVVEINQKKEQRSAALAALITRSWTGEEESQMLLLVKDSAALGSKSRVTHQELTAVLTKMMKKSKEMDDLEKQLRDQAQLVKTLPPSVTEAGKALRSKKIRELACRLSEEENAKEELENDCQQMLRCFLQTDADVRALVKRPMV